MHAIARIRAAAYDLINSEGVYFTERELLRRAGVGNGTYRHHFPSKTALIADTIQLDLQHLLDWADGVEARLGARNAFTAWLHEVAHLVLTTYGAAALLGEALENTDSGLHPMASKLLATTVPIMTRAQSHLEVRLDLAAEEVLLLAFSAAWFAEARLPGAPSIVPTEFPEERIAVSRRYLELTLKGIYRSVR